MAGGVDDLMSLGVQRRLDWGLLGVGCERDGEEKCGEPNCGEAAAKHASKDTGAS